MRFVLISLAAAMLAGAAHAETPRAIDARTEAIFAECRTAGGEPALRPEYLRSFDLNGDAAPDYVVDLSGLTCAGADSYFCGSAGCPVTVWLSGPAGYFTARDDYAQGYDIEGRTATFYLNGQFCDPPRAGVDGCEERLDFDGMTVAAAAGPTAAAPQPAETAAPSEGWTLRAVPGGAPVAVAGGVGPVRSLAAFCLDGQPWLALLFDPQPAAEAVQVTFGFSRGAIDAPARREASAGDAYVIALATVPLAGSLAGSDSRAALSVDGASLGAVSLAGSSRAIRGALGACQPF